MRRPQARSRGDVESLATLSSRGNESLCLPHQPLTGSVSGRSLTANSSQEVDWGSAHCVD
jgi:hypothetical protein